MRGLSAGNPAGRSTTMLELVWSQGRDGSSPEQVVARVARELRTGRARLCGNFRGVPVAKLLAGVG